MDEEIICFGFPCVKRDVSDSPTAGMAVDAAKRDREVPGRYGQS